MSTVYLLRHGAIFQRRPRRFVGQTDFPLTDEGRAQAALWREPLAEVPFAAAVASDLSRCLETAAIVLSGRDIPVRPEPRLREINLGQWEGLTVEEVKERFPGDYERRGQDLAHCRPRDGEGFADVQARAVAAVRELAALDGNVLVVAHGGVNRVLLCHALGLDVSHIFRLGQDYCRLNILAIDGEHWRVDAVNCAPMAPWRFPGP
ncbi:MAG: histidine phosphatase family protein [Solidesulfovibrio sp.]|uniref:histidine phosphatase family protein n=1 Tax=Solidesulfovibrio sp. TaxID=2910990 RepID=UPI002B21BB52|nr:histidine phosphatase family protein [Solidesulfovibrio sp.]MEA4856000.1 histidine phosphatase family protein [Solidesulfovibrio sp.]